jgi:hypothetical protein
MKTLSVPQSVLENMLAQWVPQVHPAYRFAKCWGCGRTLFFGMWHVFFRRLQREAHLCRRCGKPYEVEL